METSLEKQLEACNVRIRELRQELKAAPDDQKEYVQVKLTEEEDKFQELNEQLQHSG